LKCSVTDFLAAGGAGNHSWNVVRSEADHLLFKHAGESGAKVFDKTKVMSVEFQPHNKLGSGVVGDAAHDVGTPVSATWSQKESGKSGSIRFQYLVDASGRAGLVSTKYLKSRKYNQGLKNIAIWGYWDSAETYGPGVGDPFFEAIQGKLRIRYQYPSRDLTVNNTIQMEVAGSGTYHCTMVLYP
jgi:flavin-dependent dehydrogenase